MKNIKYYIIILITIISVNSLAYIELGYSYSRKKTSFDESNYFESESTTASLSFYFFERFAIETSYTNALGIREEKASETVAAQTVMQTSEVIGADLIFIVAGKGSAIQPYMKAGMAQLSRSQEVKISGLTYIIEPEKAITPSYGAGFKIKLTDRLGIKVSYDIWQTPLGNDQVTNDSAARAGITWSL